MTTPVPVPALVQASPWPALGSPSYNDEAYAAGSTQPAAFERQHEIAEASYTNAISSQESAQAAQQSALTAASAAEPALAAANFKGLWPDLVGPLEKPACVKHEGRFWMLLNNLPDVAASEPGETADWTSLDAGRVTQTITANTTAVPGVYYIATTAGITLSYEDGWTDGDETGGRNASGGACYIDWGTNTLLGETPESPMRWPSRGRFETINNGSTFA